MLQDRSHTTIHITRADYGATDNTTRARSTATVIPLRGAGTSTRHSRVPDVAERRHGADEAGVVGHGHFHGALLGRCQHVLVAARSAPARAPSGRRRTAERTPRRERRVALQLIDADDDRRRPAARVGVGVGAGRDRERRGDRLRRRRNHSGSGGGSSPLPHPVMISTARRQHERRARTPSLRPWTDRESCPASSVVVTRSRATVPRLEPLELLPRTHARTRRRTARESWCPRP